MNTSSDEQLNHAGTEQQSQSESYYEFKMPLLKETYNIIDKLKTSFSDQMSALHSQHAAIDNQMAAKESLIAAKDEQIAALNKTIAIKDEVIAAGNALIAVKDTELVHLKQKLATIMGES